MKLFILKFFLLTSFICFSQTHQLNQNEIANKFKNHYNGSNYEAIHHMLDGVMKTLISKEETAEFLKTVKLNFGLIKTMEYSGINNSAFSFRTVFEYTIADLSFAINDRNQISAFFIPRDKVENSSILVRNSTKMIFPFIEETFVYWGGENLEINYHMADMNQQYAYDIIMVANGAPHRGDSTKNESYFVFGKEIIAPCDATVVKITDGIRDNIPGEVNKDEPTGNTIVLETQRKEYLLFAHLKYKSIKVKEGDLVKQGQIIAQCGNSGNTTQAHLHLQLQNTKDLYNTIGAKLFFDEIIVNGESKKDYMPVKEDFVKNTRRFN